VRIDASERRHIAAPRAAAEALSKKKPRHSGHHQKRSSRIEDDLDGMQPGPNRHIGTMRAFTADE